MARLSGGDVLDRIMAYEAGELTDDKVIELFQELVDTGIAWSLQGSYGRTAVRLIAAGYVQDRRGEELRRHGLPDRREEGR